MRIAISGAHSLGKSTLVLDWVSKHHHYIREEEPYRALHAACYEIKFRQACTRLHNGIQLFYNASRVNRYHSTGDNVIFDRSPVDYIAYSQYTANYKTTDIDDDFVKLMVSTVRDSLRYIDILVFVPMTDLWPVEMEDDGIRPIDITYRNEVDSLFKEIYREGRFNVIPASGAPKIVEVWGPREERLQKLEQEIKDIRLL